MSTSKEVVEEKTPWIFIVVVTVLMVSLGIVWNTLLPSVSFIFFNPGSVNCAEEFASLPYLAILIGILAYMVAGRKLSSNVLTFLYATSIFCAYMAVSHYAMRVPPGFMSQRWFNPDTWSRLIPEFMAPPREVAEQILYGRAPVPWNYLTPVVLYWWLLYSFFGIYMLSIATIWRREWIEVEQVPFPQTLAVYELVKQVSERRAIKPYLIGAILGFAFQFTIFLTMIFPWFPDVFSWRCATQCYGASCIPTNHPLYSIAALAMYSKNPSLVALFYMAPLSTLFTSVIFNLLLFIVTQVAYYAGYYTQIMTVPGCGRVECGSSSLRWGAPFKWVVVAQMGGGLGLVIMQLFLHREYLRELFRSVIKPMVEEHKTMRVAFIATILSYFIIIGLLAVAGISFVNAVLIPIMVWVIFFAAVFVFSRTGYNAIGAGTYGLYWLRAIWPQLPERADANYALTCVLMRQPGSDGLSQGWGGALAASFASYKFASLTKVKPAKIYYAMLLTILIIPLVQWTTLFTIGYSIGISNLPFYQSSTFASDIFYAADPDNPWSGIAPEVMTGGPWIPHLLAGVILIWILSWLHARFVAFPLDPYGFLLTFSARSLSEGIWVMVISAWALKLLTLKIGGSKAYEEHGVPVATGFLLGYALAILAGGVISAIRFFIPF
jgi:hypothetical protein